jgi:hypothetical protein
MVPVDVGLKLKRWFWLVVSGRLLSKPYHCDRLIDLAFNQ